jgi:Protein of unknown function (DUF3147)
MMVHAKWSALKQGRWYEYVLRFALGGLATVATGLIADRWGPAIGGLFLAFPAIFCASATLIERHERERKLKDGLNGYRRGTDAAALDAWGAAVGSVGLMTFAIVVWLLTPRLPFAGIALAAFAWSLVSILIWYAQRRVRRPR